MDLDSVPTKAESAPGRTWWAGYRPVVVLTVVVIVVYGRTLGYGFTNWDDQIFIERNAVIQSMAPANLVRVLAPGGVPREMIYIPLTYLSYMLEIAIAGLDPGFMHATNLLLHLANVLLVYGLFRLLGLQSRGAFVGALAFAIHPLQAETVAWLMGRKDLLATMLALTALLSYELGRRRDDAVPWLAAAFLAFVAAILAKPALIILPALLVLLDLRRERDWGKVGWLQILPFLLAASVVFGLHLSMPRRGGPVPAPAVRLAGLCWLGWHWFRQLLLLGRPVPLYCWPPRLAWLGLPVFAAFAGLLAAAWRRRWTWIWFGLGFWALAFVPAAKIVLDHRDFITADRYGYFPVIGIALLLGVGWQSLPPGRWRQPAQAAMVLWFLVAAVNVVLAVDVWRSSAAVWERVVRVYPEALLPRLNRATTLAEMGQGAKARRDYETALRLDGDSLEVLTAFAAFRLRRGEYDEARSLLQTAAARYGKSWRVPFLTGQLFEGQGRWDAARSAYEAAWKAQLALPPVQQSKSAQADIGFRLARIYRQLGLDAKSRRTAEEVLILDPAHAGAKALLRSD